MDPAPITELPNLATITGVTTGTIFLVYLIKRGRPTLGGWRAVATAVGIGVGLSLAGMILAKTPLGAASLTTAILNGVFGGGVGALAAKAVRSQRPA